MLLVILFYALFASTFPISKALLSYAPPLFVTGTRMLLAGILLLIANRIKYPQKQILSFSCLKKCIFIFIQIIIIGIYINYIARFWALNHMPSAKACLLFSIDPILSLFFSYLAFGETNTKRQWLGFLVGFGALIPVLITSSHGEAPLGEFLNISWPELIMLISVTTNSYRWVLIRKMVAKYKYSSTLVNGLSMTFGGLLALATSYFVEGAWPVTAPLHFFGLLFLATFISNVIGYSFYSHLLRRYTATFLSLAGFTTPLFAAFYDWLFFGETVSWLFYFSTFLLLMSLMLFYKDEPQTKYANEEMIKP